ncbi:MAG: SpoVA/SpoVAEb family sporulation membrane protein [Lachnospiraceae bacterium]|nr:SpoVA/SpoVAEb family sporulation membrane protein [Lachnospiraceae bacterium]
MNNNVEIKDVLKENDPTKRDKKYNDYVKKVTPTHNFAQNILRAYVVGGGICVLGQLLTNMYMNMGASEENAKLYNIISLIGLSVIFTGFGWYSKFANYAGAGTLVPITGFANSVASAAIEFKREGQVFGIGCRIFSIAGPVILYGVFASWILGVVYWIINMF